MNIKKVSKDNKFNIPFPTRHSHSLVYIPPNSIYIFGGEDQNHFFVKVFNDLIRYDIYRKSFQVIQTKNPPIGRLGHSSFQYENKLYILCGSNEEIFLSDILVLDFTTLTWSEIDTEAHPIGREYPVCVFHEPTQNIFLYGGFGPNCLFDSTFKLNLHERKWMLLPLENKPKARYDPAYYLHGDTLYIHGGDGSEDLLNDFWEFNCVTHIWREIQFSNLPEKRRGHIIIGKGNELLLYGGYKTNFTEYGDIYIYSTTKNRWSRVEISLPNRIFHRAVLVERSIYIVGGLNEKSICAIDDPIIIFDLYPMELLKLLWTLQERKFIDVTIEFT